MSVCLCVCVSLLVIVPSEWSRDAYRDLAFYQGTLLKPSSAACVVMIYDCRHALISVNGFDVTRMTVLGLAVELFLSLAVRGNRGFAGVEPGDVQHVSISQCHLGGQYQSAPIRVKVFLEWAQVAFRLAKRIADHFHNHEIRIFDAVRPHHKGTKKLGEHDLVGEYVAADAPGLLSIEIKCQTVKHPGNLQQYRMDLRRTQADEHPMWLHCKTLKKPPWLERHIVMIDFPTVDSERYRGIRCEALDKSGRWKDVYGWSGVVVGGTSEASNAQQTPRAASVTRRPTSQITCGGTNLNGERIYHHASVRKATKRNLEYASVGDFLKAIHEQIQSESARKKRRHPEHWMKEWPKHFKWKGHDWGSFSEFRPSHGGGLTGFGATEKACMEIFQQCK